MSILKCKGKDLKPFVKALSILGKDVQEFRIESNGCLMTGSATPASHNALIFAKMDLDGLSTEGMEDLTVAVDMRDFKLLSDMADPDDDMVMSIDLGRLNMKVGKHAQRSCPLVQQIPPPLNPNVVLPFSWKIPVEDIKPIVKALDLSDKYASLHINLDDGGLRFATESYGGKAKASYTLAKEDIKEPNNLDDHFKVRYPFGNFVTLKDIPAEGDLSFRVGQDLPLEVNAATGRLTVRAMYAPMIETV